MPPASGSGLAGSASARRFQARSASASSCSGAISSRISLSSRATNWLVRFASDTARRMRSCAISPSSRPGVRPKSDWNSSSVTRLKTMPSVRATDSSTPDARPMPVATNTKTASLLSSSVVRNRTAATMPARLNASARLYFTITTTPATTTGSRISECTTDWR